MRCRCTIRNITQAIQCAPERQLPTNNYGRTNTACDLSRKHQTDPTKLNKVSDPPSWFLNRHENLARYQPPSGRQFSARSDPDEGSTVTLPLHWILTNARR
jgi:hypothetical protein